MAGRETPTNDRIVALLHDVLREPKELGFVSSASRRTLAKIAKATR